MPASLRWTNICLVLLSINTLLTGDTLVLFPGVRSNGCSRAGTPVFHTQLAIFTPGCDSCAPCCCQQSSSYFPMGYLFISLLLLCLSRVERRKGGGGGAKREANDRIQTEPLIRQWCLLLGCAAEGVEARAQALHAGVCV